MTKEQEVKDLETVILIAKKYYYNVGNPLFDDWIYDRLEDRLGALDPSSKVFNMVGYPPGES